MLLISNIEEYQKIYICDWENIGQEVRLKNIDETRNYFIEEINQNESIGRRHKKVCGVLNFFEHLPILVCEVSGCASISAFASLVAIPVATRSSVIELKICAITARIKKYKSVIKKKEKKHCKIVLLAKTKLNRIEFFICKASVDLNITHDEFVSINVLKEYDDVKEEIKNSKT